MLELNGITKSYGVAGARRRELPGSVGRLTGFVGGNGAGKTTTMRIVLGVLGRDGEVTLDGARHRGRPTPFGYMPEERGLYPKMRVLEHIVYLARLHGSTRPRPPRARRCSSSSVSASACATTSRRSRSAISSADRRRSCTTRRCSSSTSRSRASIRSPSTSSRACCRRAAQGAAVLFSSHQLDVVERLCDDLVIIADGTIRAAGTRRPPRRARPAPLRADLGGDLGWLRDEPGVDALFDGGYALFDVDDAAAQRAAARGLRGRCRELLPSSPLAQIFKEVIQ
jgi:ABC-2 type transport system ATP-binding protein